MGGEGGRAGKEGREEGEKGRGERGVEGGEGEKKKGREGEGKREKEGERGRERKTKKPHVYVPRDKITPSPSAWQPQEVPSHSLVLENTLMRWSHSRPNRLSVNSSVSSNLTVVHVCNVHTCT